MREIQPLQLVAAEHAPDVNVEIAAEDEDADDRNALGDEELLEFLFNQGLLPSCAFPTDLTSFLVERLGPPIAGRRRKMEIVERPQQGIGKALSEYAPGRLIVINKETYRSGGVVANTLPTAHDRAAPLFADVQEIVHCDTCSFVRDLEDEQAEATNCPVCPGTLQRTRMIEPQVFLPEGGRALAEDDRDQDITYATGAQFPVPVGANDVPDLRPIGARLAVAVTTNRRLITANKGQLQNDTFQGFWICDRCGRTTLEQPPAASHDRPYLIEFSFGPNPPRQCNNPIVLRTLEDALYSVAEALRLAASRHPQLDLDPSEFGAGFRIVPSTTETADQLHLDVYLYDTLSGGAGYAELAGRHLEEILDSVLALLENCPADCDRSCESCLRHYHNQHLRDRLDRFVGAQLLRYGRTGELPAEATAAVQAASLEALARLLQLDGFTCTPLAQVDGQIVPMLVARGGGNVAVCTQSALLEAGWEGHSLTRLRQGCHRRVLNDYILRRNLPDEHRLVGEAFQNL